MFSEEIQQHSPMALSSLPCLRRHRTGGSQPAASGISSIISQVDHVHFQQSFLARSLQWNGKRTLSRSGTTDMISILILNFILIFRMLQKIFLAVNDLFFPAPLFQSPPMNSSISCFVFLLFCRFAHPFGRVWNTADWNFILSISSAGAMSR